MREGWGETTLGELLKQVHRPVKVATEISIAYAGVRWYAQGVYARDVSDASTVRAKSLDRLVIGDITYNRMWATKAAFGVVSEAATGCLVTNDFPIFVASRHFLPAFARLLFQFPDFQASASQLATGTTERRRLKERDFLSISVRLPPVAEQQSIVDLMLAVDQTTTEASRINQAGELLAQSLREQLIFNGAAPLSKLRDISTHRGLIGGPFGSTLVTKDYKRSGVPVIRGTNLSCGRHIGGDFAFVSEEKAESLARNIALPDDLIATQRGTLGQVALVPRGRHPRYVISQSQMRLRPNADVADVEYVYVALSSDRMKHEVESRKIATANPHINLGIFGELEIPVPPLTEQRRIVAIVLGAEDALTASVALVTRLDALYVSLLDSLLSGRHRIPSNYDELLEMGS